MHDGGRFIERYAEALSLTHDEVKSYWRKLFEDHSSDATEYFAGSTKFLVFDIESDDPARLASFLAPEFKLDPSAWGHRGATAPKLAGTPAG